MLLRQLRLLALNITGYKRSAAMDIQRTLSSSSTGSDGPGSPSSPGSPVDHGTMVALCKSVLPPLSYNKHKGEAGRIGIIGGCEAYTGAPYYAGISSLKVGGDLAFIFCTSGAATPIKSYSPELIVNPLLDSANAVDDISKWLTRLHALVVGPGLGRAEPILSTTKAILQKAKRMRIPMVIDADGLHLITQEPDIIKGYTKATLTPNAAEFSRLYTQVLGQKPEEADDVASTIQVSKELGNVTICRKGHEDIIVTGGKVVTCSVEGSARRCGGQGDLLAGSMGTFLHWAYAAQKTTDSYLLKTQGANMTAAYMACALTRACNQRAFAIHRRSTTTPNMIEQIPHAFQHLFEPVDS